MESSTPARVLVVAHKTAATPALIEAVRERAQRGPATFTLLVPNATHGLEAMLDSGNHEETAEAQTVIELAIPLLEEAAGADVHTIGDLHRALAHADGSLALDVVRGVDDRKVDVTLDAAA